MPELNLMPGKTVSLQCILLSYIEDGQCQTPLHQVSLTWVDEAGTEIQEDSQHQIRKDSSCAVTLTVTLKSPENKKFRCQATVDDEVQTSVELRVRVPVCMTDPNKKTPPRCLRQRINYNNFFYL